MSVGDETAKIGVVIDRSVLTVKQAEHFLCGSRLEAVMAADPNGSSDIPDQGKFWDDAETIKSVVDCKSYRATPKRIGAGFTFSLEAIEVRDLVHLAKTAGRIRLQRIGDAESKRDSSSDAGNDDSGADLLLNTSEG